MTQIPQPALWLLVLIGGLPLLSETVYTPSLPEISHALSASESLTEHTLTIFLFGFALGTLFWGILSDRLGRKPCMMAGMLLFFLGSAACYFSGSIEALLISRLLQAFGGSVSSILGQAICRDAFHGPALGKAYAMIGSSLSFFPAIGPLLGGALSQQYGWSASFLVLMMASLILACVTFLKLPETHGVQHRQAHSIKNIAQKLFSDRRVLSFAVIVAACNGITFSYYAEGSFYLIEILGASPTLYGATFLGIAASSMAGGLLSKKWAKTHAGEKIIRRGILCVVASMTILSACVMVHTMIIPLMPSLLMVITVGSMMLSVLGICMTTSNALALALVEYKGCIGTASSLFGALYYTLISGFTFIMGCLHNGTLIPMPLYFLGLSLLMFVITQRK